MKKIICIILSLLVLISAAVVSTSAVDSEKSETGEGNLIYFDAKGWKNITNVYCHIWIRGGDAFYSWMTRKEECNSVGGTKYSYDLSSINLKDGEDYCVIFTAKPTMVQTYDATFSKACIGDTLKLTGNKVENPVDSEKKSDEAVWTKNSGSYGPHLAFTSIGNIVGKFLCPNEKGTEIIGDWLSNYYKSPHVNAVEALALAYPKFGIKSSKDIETIYKNICKKKTGEDEALMKKMLESAFAKAYPFKLKKTKATVYVNKDYKIPFKGKVYGNISYKSSKPSIAEVFYGVVYPHKKGKATITVKSGNTKKKLKLTVKNPYLKKKTLTIKKGKSEKINIIGKNKLTLYYSKNKSIATVSAKGKIKALKKGTVKINILTNGTYINKLASLKTGKTQTTMSNGIKLVLKVKVV